MKIIFDGNQLCYKDTYNEEILEMNPSLCFLKNNPNNIQEAIDEFKVYSCKKSLKYKKTPLYLLDMAEEKPLILILFIKQ